MILTLSASFGSVVSLDFTQRFGDAVELQCFQFVTPPIEFRLVRQGAPLQEWQAGNNDMYDLQHPAGVMRWARDGHWFINDLNHRTDVVTCGVLSKGLSIETRGLALNFVLEVWIRESTLRGLRG